MMKLVKYRIPELRFLIGVSLLGLCVLGCQPEPKVETITVPLSQSGLPIKVASESRMVVAVAVRDDATWFFKVTGPASLVDQTETSWIDFLKQVSFGADGNPVWQAPADWKVGGERAGRFATLFVASQGSERVEMAISSLGPDFDVLSNFNRWRGQMGLAPTSAAELDDEVGELEFTDGKYLMFDRKGSMQGMGGPPFANGGMAAAETARPEDVRAEAVEATSSAEVPELRYEIPSGWELVPNVPVVALRLEKKMDDAVLQISVTPMPSKLALWPNSVQSWLAETGAVANLDEIMASRTRPIQVSGASAQRIDLVDLEGSTKHVVGVRCELGDRAWFVKLAGPPQRVEESLADFDQFLASLKF